MTLVNAWWRGGGESGPPAERRVFLQCDGCLPPEFFFGTPQWAREVGWRFEDAERGEHRCRWCADRTPADGPRRQSPLEPRPALPNLLVIGAAKCGTTSMHRYLSLHPEIHMSHSKEVRFFQDPGCLDKLDQYATFFDRDARVRGESSPRYSFHPLVPGVPERIHAALPDVRMIYLVRDPIERAASQWMDWRSQQWREESESFENALGDLDDPFNEYVAAGRYATQLKRFLSVFPREQILVIDQLDLLHDRERTMRTAFRFLDVGEAFAAAGFEETRNPRSAKRVPTRGYASLSSGRLAGAVRRRVPARARRLLLSPLRRIGSRSIESPVVGAELEARLKDVFRGEIERLRELTGQEFAEWPTDPVTSTTSV